MGWYSDSHLLLIYRELTVDSGIGESLFCYVVGGGDYLLFFGVFRVQIIRSAIFCTYITKSGF